MSSPVYAGAERNLSATVGFAEKIRAAVASIASNPLRFPSLGPEQCFCLLKRFPYLLAFRVTDTKIRILAVAHASRRPGYWIARD